MSRIRALEKRVHKTLRDMEHPAGRAKAAAHLHGVALAAVMLAKKRGRDAELAAMAGLLHDLYAYRSGSWEDHARRGAKLARRLLEKSGLTSPEETDIICSAIRHHSDKEAVDAPMDEILKDADVIHHALADPSKEVKPHEKARYERLCEEFGMTP